MGWGETMRRVFFLFALMLATGAWAGQVELKEVRVWTAPDNTRVVFDLSGAVDFHVFTLSHPTRVVVDMVDTRSASKVLIKSPDNSPIRDMRSGVRHGNDLRLVLDMVTPAADPHAILLPPHGKRGYRLAVDLGVAPQGSADTRQVSSGSPSPAPAKVAATADDRSTAAASTVSVVYKPIVVAIDAGHGGADSGAIGVGGLMEKNVTLSIAKRLARLVNAQPGMHAFLTRKGDYYVGLRERIELARKAKADLFISIHADAFPDRSAQGSSVYVLSEHGASSEAARWLAQRENAADLVGGVSLEDKDPTLASVLLDLSQTSAIEASFDVAGRLLGELDNLGPVHMSKVQQAAFVVLKSPDIPSVLVETAFITNPVGARHLRSASFQQHMAKSLMAGIKGYFSQYRPERVIAGGVRQYVIKPGDTLSGIAQQYQVSTGRLRAANALSSSTIRVGQVLNIPSDSGG